MKHYKVIDKRTNDEILRYAVAKDVLRVTGMYPTMLTSYAGNGVLYKGVFLIEYDYACDVAEEWERVCAWLRDEPVRPPSTN